MQIIQGLIFQSKQLYRTRFLNDQYIIAYTVSDEPWLLHRALSSLHPNTKKGHEQWIFVTQTQSTVAMP